MKFDKNSPDLPGAVGGELLRQRARATLKVPFEINLAECSIEELLSFRQQVNAKLPAVNLKDMDLSQELVIQVLALQQAQANALADEEAPVNQKSQAMNALSAALGTLVRLQNDTFTSERLKKAEVILIDAIQELPDEVQARFIERYSAALGRLA